MNGLELLYRWLDERMRRRWNRSMPLLEDGLDRWQRARRLGFGEGTSIYHLSYVYGDVRVGRDTWIGPFTLLDGSGGLEIGDHCSISAGVHIYSHNTVDWAVNAADYEQAPTKIGSHCFIGPNAVIAMGVTIGDQVVVGACSYVNRDIPSGERVGGVPAKPLSGKSLAD